MPYLKILIDRFDRNKDHPLKRAIDVLDMIEFSITYPACDTITNYELNEIDRRVKKVQTELKDDPILANRIEKWWMKRETCKATAKKVHAHGSDHITILQYHERIISIRNAKVALIKRLRGEGSTMEEHGLFGSRFPQLSTIIDSN
ncbi:MAG: hypothetical protein ACFFCP_06965 [Promethearchaeota archaeon]